MFNVGVIGWRMCIFVDLANVVHRVPLIRFSEMPRPKWTKESSERYWEQRPSRVILRSTNICQLNETRAGHRSERLRKRAMRKEEFPRAFRVPTRSTMSKRVFTETANDLRCWAEHRSWAYCTRCASLQSKKLPLRTISKPNQRVPSHVRAALADIRCLTRGEFQQSCKI